ncbi:Arogenate dehydrogenase [Richelia intracellularis HH01]|uniref:Arogenate dehydrogenase n=1 Tax=Richelia intracellularis HH01 TaxID=1165094 RepID=M1WR51_9NOST|nr:Arogenate dehydrogenase [Richelia intracellularis HH01]
MNIGILRLGIIGGSLGFDLRSQGHYVLGVSHRSSTCKTAINMGCVDVAGIDTNLMTHADIIFICTPMDLIMPKFLELTVHISTSCIIIDIGSVKNPIVRAITPHWQNFIGGHPMAGKSDSGIKAAQSSLFFDKPYVLILADTTPWSVVEVMSELVG